MFTPGKEKNLGETCLSLSSGISDVRGTDAGEADYETYTHLKKPPLRPEQTLETFQIEEGFRIEVVAHEPVVTDPVTMDVDSDGRLWVVDMPSYMPVHDMDEEETALREQVPQGRIVVLEDTTGDGIMDKHFVFREGLVLPRSIKVLNDGVLVGEPPHLWFIRDTTGDGKGDTRELVSDSYGDPSSSTVQSLPSGLVWGMDNWIHSAGDGSRSFRRIDGQWETRPFRRLGQWGMTQNNWGRLYSSSNSWPLETHLVPYGYSDRHPLFDVSTGKNVRIAPNEPLWPAHPTGVNRGYRVGIVVREDGTLRQNTAATTPVVYRGGQFGDEYAGNAFTPEPAGNLIKRLIIQEDPAEIEAEAHFAYEGREFLTSTDERFRPVNIANAPDGSLYVVDMYRGLFEYVRFITDHLMEYTLEHGLHKPTGKFGRIYRIVRDDGNHRNPETPRFSDLMPGDLVGYLSHKNGHLRDQAQQVLAQCSPASVIPSLQELAFDESAEPHVRLHALWTLEGFSPSVYPREKLAGLALQALNDPHPRMRSSAIRMLEPSIREGDKSTLARLGEMTRTETAPYVRLQLLASLGESAEESSLHLIADLLNRHADSPYFREMALTGIYLRELEMASILRNEYGWNEGQSEERDEILTDLAEAAEEQPEADLSHLTEAERNLYENGSQLYSTCMSCHGPEGQGVGGLGTSLAGSEWVQNDPEGVVRVVLHGFEGGAAERGEEIPSVMPAHGSLSDENLASILTYIRQSWGNDAGPVRPGDVSRIREESGGRRETWSPDELRELLNGL
ncbi:MAG: c-type cytochrome [Balneolaceae bacterium]